MTERSQDDLSDIWEDGPPVRRQAVPSPRRAAKPKPRRTRPPPRRRWLSVLGYSGLALACLCTAAVAFLLIAAPVELVRDRAIEQVKARTGRDLVVAGPTTLSLFPRPAVSLSNVSLSAPEGMEAPPTLTVPMIDAELRLWSLLTAQPAVERITLRRPTIELTVNTQGRRSWDATGIREWRLRSILPSAGPDTHEPPGGPLPANEPGPGRSQSKLIAGSIRILDGTLRYNDLGSGTHSEIESLNLTLAADDPSGPLQLNGTLAVRGAPLTVAGSVSPMHALLSEQPAQLAFKVSGAPFEATYQGKLALGANISFDGDIKLVAASARALGDWLGRPLPANGDPDTVTLSAGLKVAKDLAVVSNLDASWGAGIMTGSLTLDSKQARRRLIGNLDISELDFGKLLVKPDRNRKTASRPSTPPAAAPLPPTSPATAPPISGTPDRPNRDRGWSDDPINLSILGQLDANLTLSARSIVYKDVKTGPSRLSVALESGLGKISLEDIELYGGRGHGVLTLDGTGAVLATGANLKLEGVALRPVLSDALQLNWLEGRGNISLVLAGQGLSERQIVEALNGKVEMASANGAIVGLDVSKVVRSLQRGRLPSLTSSPDEKTPFSELAGTFTITNGVAKNQDLRLVSTHVQLSGEGTLDLGPRQIDYTVRTKIGSGPAEPDATIKVGTLEVPVSIVGPWEKPVFGIKGQEELTGAAKKIRKNLKSQDVRDAIKSLLQGDSEKRVKPRDLIDKLLKKD